MIDQNEIRETEFRNWIDQFEGKEPGYSIVELAKNPLTVVLGEARSGKTTELRMAAASLMDIGQKAFFLRIEDLNQGTGHHIEVLRNAIENETISIDEWLASQVDGIFLLDSVDEAKLVSSGDFRRAIGVFKNALSDHLNRIHLVVSCRVTEWRPKDDAVPLLELLPRLASAKDKDENSNESGFKLVQIIPLDKRRIEILAAHTGLEGPDPFIQAIRESDAFEYAERPGDVIGLIDLWQRESRLGTLSEIVEHNIRRKLKEEADIYDAVISEEKARMGAERLAAASILCKESSIRFSPLDQFTENTVQAIDPFDLLQDWKREEIRALLRRPVFDEATYGRVRFHTRSVREYLAAGWFRQRHTQGCSATNLAQVFFVKRCGRTAAIPGLKPIAAWLAPHQSELMDTLIKSNPEVLVDGGDPHALPVHVRVRVLDEMIYRYGDRRSYIGFRYDRHGLRRFAHGDLAEAIHAHLKKKSAPEDILKLLLDLIQAGRLNGCKDIAFQYAIDNSLSTDVRVDALLALKECAAEPELRDVYNHILSSTNVSDRLYGWVLLTCYPFAIGVSGFIRLLIEAPVIATTTENCVKDFAEKSVDQESDIRRLGILVPKLYDLLANNVAEGNYETGPYDWLLPAFCSALVNWLEQTQAKYTREWLYDGLVLLENLHSTDYHVNKARRKVCKILSNAPADIREVCLWKAHSAYTKRTGEQRIWYMQLMPYNWTWMLCPDDIDWLVDRVGSTNDHSIRFTAFDAAIYLCLTNDRLAFRLDDLGRIAARYGFLKIHLERRLAPSPQRAYELKSEMRSWVQELRESSALIKLQEEVLAKLDEIAAGRLEGLLVQMFHYIDRPDGGWTGNDVWGLKSKFDLQGAEAFRSGVIEFWPSWEPKDGHRFGDDLSLIGVACAVSDGLKFSGLGAKAVHNLTLLAFKEIQLPEWFRSLVKTHPKTVKSVIEPWLATELDRNQTPEDHPKVLMELEHAGGELLGSFIEPVARLAKQNMPVAVGARGRVAKALSGGEHQYHLKEMVEQYLGAKSDLESEDLFWIAVWLQVSAMDALDWFEARLVDCPHERADVFVEQLASMLDSRHQDEVVLPGRPDYVSVPELSRLIPIIYKHVRHEDDTRHYGSYSPTSRDAAQSFRSDLISSLANIPGEEALRALLGVRETINSQTTEDWILCEADLKVGRDADRTWKDTEVLEFEKHFECSVQNSDDLFSILLGRIIELKDQFETGDYSPRDLFKVDTDESVLQKFLAQRIDEISLSVFI